MATSPALLRRSEQVVSSVRDLLVVAQDPGTKTITVAADLFDCPQLRLAPGVTLRGPAGRQTTLEFSPGFDGVCLSTGNSVENLDLRVSPERCAIWNDESAASLGTLALRNLATIGRVRILAGGNIRGGHVIIDGLDIISANARAEQPRPHDYGVFVLQGAFTLWNLQPDPAVVITADLGGISAGRLGAPVLGCGVFVGGAGQTRAARLEIQHLETNAVYSDGRIVPGTADIISGGVFVVHGAKVDRVSNHGPVTTYGSNDMALDNWGYVDRWIVRDKITTFGPSGVGFVNFGEIGELRVEAPIETFGLGARGFNVYTGTVHRAEFDRIVTHADGAVGVQISQPVGRLTVRRGIETHGAFGDSLVKGALTKLAATALSIKPGGSVQTIEIDGGLRTHGAGVMPLEQHGSVASLRIDGGFDSASASSSA
jgi:hypothetical protein